MKRLRTENKQLKQRPARQFPLDAFIGESPSAQKIKKMIQTVADSDTSVLITGRTGTGKELVAERKFRADLYYRLNVFPIHHTPLRERREDVAILLDHFLKQLAADQNLRLSSEVGDCLTNYDWPGNVRELKNVTERLILLSRQNPAAVDTVPQEILQADCSVPEVCLGKLPLEKILQDVE